MEILLVEFFFDPPYATDRASTYKHDTFSVSDDVREWCIENGNEPLYRIALCGYDEEHNVLVDKYGWDVFEWKANGGYANQAKDDSQGKQNKLKERIWFSPHCIKEKTLFDFS